MSLIRCCECNEQISEYAEFCPKCGCPMNVIKNNCVKQGTFFYNNILYDIEDVTVLLNKGETVPAIKLLANILNISLGDAKFIIDVIKFNNNEIPADYNECLERLREYNSRGHRNSPKCPTCGSMNVEKISLSKKVVGGAMFGLFSSSVRKTMHCKNCGYKW